MKGKRFSAYWPDFIVLVLLFIIALTMRFTYQNESIIEAPIRADAREYFFVAYNLYHFNVYSTTASSPGSRIKPKPNFNRPPGYPLFLYPFVATSKNGKQFIDRVTAAQAIIGSLTVIATYLLGRLCFNLLWAFTAGLLTALSPHLVAIDHFILTESLFTFTMVVAVLVFVISWQRRKLSLSVFAGVLFGFSILIRPIALLIVPFMVVCYFIQGRNIGFASKSALLTQVFCLVVGCAAIYSPYLAYRNQSSQEGFSVSNQSISQKIVLGADINLRNFIKAKTDPELRSEIARMTRDKMYTLKVFKERFLNDPFSYLKWYIGGKVVFMWHWDSTYIGDVYQYPMIKKGFHTHALLHAVHTLMRFLHWPLYVFAILSPIFLFGIRRLLRSHSKTVFLIPSFFIFLYFAALLTLLIPLPRYAIPIRPFIYILGVFVLAQILQTTCYVFKMKSSGLTNKVLLMNS